MRRLRGTVPSPALVVAALALTLAMVGTSVAQDPTARLTRSKVRKIANQEIDKRAPSLSVANAVNAAKAKQADTATHATTADSATEATKLNGLGAAAFVQVKTDRVRSDEQNAELTNYDQTNNLVLVPNVAGGSYVAQAKLEIDNDAAAIEAVQCVLQRSGADEDTTEQVLGANGAAAQELGFTLSDVLTTSANGTDDIGVKCQNPGGDNDADHITLILQLINN